MRTLDCTQVSARRPQCAAGMRSILSTSLFLALATIAGCAADGGDMPGQTGGGGGGKADGTGDEGLHVTAEVTTLGEYNEIRWPVAVDDASEVDDVINQALAFDTVTGESLEDTKRAWAEDPEGIHPGVDAADFEVNANIRNVLSLTVNYETIYAYPDQQRVFFNFNANTGATVAITDILDASALPVLAARFDAELQTRIAQLKQDFATDIASGDVDASTWDNLHVTAEDLQSFSTTADGITFHYDAGFPHVIVALEPDGDFAMSIDELDEYISADGLWAGEY
jgi:hypothetical protein